MTASVSLRNVLTFAADPRTVQKPISDIFVYAMGGTKLKFSAMHPTRAKKTHNMETV
jgi:hypothetical protein